MYKVFITLLLITSSVAAQAWNNTGHRLVAVMVYELLAPVSRQQILQRLSGHPRYQQDFLKQRPEGYSNWNEKDQQRWLFAQMALWPDFVRGLGKKVQSKYSHKSWHYINLPIFPVAEGTQGDNAVSIANVSSDIAATKPRQFNIIQALIWLDASDDTVQLESVSEGLKLCWLFHLIADIHQPLHASSMYTPIAFRNGDKGGNLLYVGNKRLHTVWDGAAGHYGFEAIKAIAMRYLHEDGLYKRMPAQSIYLPGSLAAYELWLQQSYDLAVRYVYTGSIRKAVLANDRKGVHVKLQLDELYYKNMQRVAQQQLVAAAYRLAAVLEARYELAGDIVE
jgi:S1/P1 Nuclease